MFTSRLVRSGCAALLVSWLAAPALASDIWVVQFQTPFPDVIPPCQTLVSWHSHLLFHNPTEQDAEVKLLDVSNGGKQLGTANLTVSPHRTASVRGLDPATLKWNPPDDIPLWVNRLDVPEGFVVANRVEAQIAELVERIGPSLHLADPVQCRPSSEGLQEPRTGGRTTISPRNRHR